MKMTAAQKIMKKKAFIKAEMDRQLPKAQSDDLWLKAAEKLDAIMKQYASLAAIAGALYWLAGRLQ